MLHSIEDFLAHALALEADSAEMFARLAADLEQGQNSLVTDLFRRLAHSSQLHLNDVRAAAEGMILPVYSPQQYCWSGQTPPETIPTSLMTGAITPADALLAALHSEEQGEAFYAAVAATTTDSAVRRMAQDFAAEEAGHVSLLAQWLASIK